MNHKHAANELQNEINDLKRNIRDIKSTVVRKISDTVESIPDTLITREAEVEAKIAQKIEDKPFVSLGYAAIVGFVLGAFITNKIK